MESEHSMRSSALVAPPLLTELVHASGAQSTGHPARVAMCQGLGGPPRPGRIALPYERLKRRLRNPRFSAGVFGSFTLSG
jgi:hypothetical protein